MNFRGREINVNRIVSVSHLAENKYKAFKSGREYSFSVTHKIKIFNNNTLKNDIESEKIIFCSKNLEGLRKDREEILRLWRLN